MIAYDDLTLDTSPCEKEEGGEQSSMFARVSAIVAE